MEARLAALADAARLAALHKACFGPAGWSASQIAESLRLETTLGLMAESDGDAAAVILCQITPEAEAEVLTLAVRPELRRCGLGLLLLHAAMDAARARKAKRLFLEVAADNAAALALYEKAGFGAIGRRRGYYARNDGSVDAVMMGASL